MFVQRAVRWRCMYTSLDWTFYIEIMTSFSIINSNESGVLSLNVINTPTWHPWVMGLYTLDHLMPLDMFLKFQNNNIHSYWNNWRLQVNFNQNSKSEKGAQINSVKINSRAMGLYTLGHLMTLDKCVKFQSNNIHSYWNNWRLQVNFNQNFKSKKGHNSVKNWF